MTQTQSSAASMPETSASEAILAAARPLTGAFNKREQGGLIGGGLDTAGGGSLAAPSVMPRRAF